MGERLRPFRYGKQEQKAGAWFLPQKTRADVRAREKENCF